ncbi:MAG: hypothetical protein ACREH3_13320 [Geminicoccales bacterium]
MADIIDIDKQRIARGRPMMRADVRAHRLGQAESRADPTDRIRDRARAVAAGGAAGKAELIDKLLGRLDRDVSLSKSRRAKTRRFLEEDKNTA